jgi:predicted ATPase/DNA-binding SARP family transcriptional activator
MLGPLEVRDSSGAVAEVGGARLRALLIMLALRPGQLVTASQLIDGLWGEQTPAEPGNALQALVSRLRRALPEADLGSLPAGYRLAIGATDIARFDDLAAAGRRHLRAGDPAAAATALREALGLWRGPALAEVADSEWGQAVIARLNELRLTAIQDRIAADLALGHAADLVGELEGLVAEHPTREPLAALLMRALRADGRRGEALEVYERARKRLAEQLGTDPSAELNAVYLDTLREDVPDNSKISNLPVALTSFVGRESDVVQVSGLLTAHRLVTLTGPGGAGKTRLAVEAARTVPADQTWLVELAPVTDPAEVAATVISTLGLHEQTLILRGTQQRQPVTDPVARLISALGGKSVLLVLDNCEHLIGAAALLAERVLRACPDARMLATSREPLNITGEALLPVGPLAPRPAALLLAERASAVSPGFAITADTEPAVARICRALDGMPLAIELAAARMRTMGPEQVAARLDDRFRLLTGGSRTALPRHQTLRAVVDWSWELLGDEEQALWRRFSVFSGGATLDAAEHVAGATLDLLTALADKSVLTIRQTPDGPRYWMLEIIRAYGQERLAEAGETEQIRAAHARYFLWFADESVLRLISRDQLIFVRRLSDDQENLHSAIRAAIAAGDADTAVGLTGSLGWYWWLRSMKAEGADLIAAALTLAGQVSDPERLAVAYLMGGMLAFDTARVESAAGWVREAARLAERIPEPVNPAVRLARPAALILGDRFGDASLPAAYDEAVADAHPWVSAMARMIRGQVIINFGTGLDQAEADFAAAAAAGETLGERWILAASLQALGVLEGQRGNFAAAIGHLERAVALAGAIGAVEDEGQFRLFLARILWLDGRRDRARREVDRAITDADRIGWPESQAFARYTAGSLARLDGRYEAARAHLARAAEFAISPGIGYQLRAIVGSESGYVAAETGDLDQARRLHRQAWADIRPIQDAPRIAEVIVGLADLAMRDADPGRAATLLGASAAIRGTTDSSYVDEVRVEGQVRALLSPAGFATAYERGRAMSVDAVSAFIDELSLATLSRAKDRSPTALADDWSTLSAYWLAIGRRIRPVEISVGPRVWHRRGRAW